MDPIGLSLDNFDVIGKWRTRENGTALDTRGQLYDGTPVSNPSELQAALLKYRVALVRTFTKNLMSYALGRRIEPTDMSAIRTIVRDAEENEYKMSAFLLGVVKSDQFRTKASPAVTETAQGNR